MKAVIILVVLLAAVSAGWWAVAGVTPEEQLEYLKVSLQSEKAENTANSAAKLGKVLKSNFDDAQDVYQNGAEATYE